MRFLHVAASMSPEWGGPVAAVRGLTAALVRRGVVCSVVTASGRRVGTDVVTIPGVPVHRFDTEAPARFWTAYSTRLAAFLDERLVAGEFDIVYIHEIWHHASFAAARAARGRGIPYVQVFHGALDEWRLRQKRLRKLVYSRAALKRFANGASALHVLTEAEKARAAVLGFTAPAFVIPNAVDTEQLEASPDASDFLSRRPRLRGKRVVLFLGRIHPMKGLDILARAFARLAAGRDDAVLLVVGPDEDDEQGAVESILRTSGVLDRVEFTGMLTGDDKAAALACADVFVLPSHSEGFSHAIIEAMAAGLPVVISEHCHFPDVAEHEAGFVVENEAAAVANAVGALLLDDDLRVRMGRNGRRLVAERYTWDAVARTVEDMARDILRR